MPPRRARKSRSSPRRRTKARTRTRRSDLRRVLTLALALLLVAASCTTDPPRVLKTDVADGPRLAHRAAGILLQVAAYDHAVVGGLRGEKVRAITPERYATVARGILRDITALASDTVVAAADREGSVRDRVLALADTLTVVGRDIGTYADGGEPGALARVLAGVPGAWQRLIDLMSVLPADQDLSAIVARGRSFESTARVDRHFALTVGPFTSQAEADAAARRIGQVESVARASPFVVRVGTFPDRAAATTAQTRLAALGFSTSAIAEEERVTFARSGAAPDAELWREPARVFDTHGAARRVSISPDGAWLATGSDDGVVAIFSSQGVLRALPQFNAGIAHLVFSDDGEWLFAGGLTLANIRVPSGQVFGTNVRLPNAAAQAVFVPRARAFAASSRGPTGEPSGGPGAIVGRAPDGVTLGSPFPLT
ncbi:MAG TPA: SPOR domain-containing protein, partial [Candidatus Limnocylindria bacterium]|nr:SPOR domain-containing protein [Candidatus Limnocylindria bacterium]